MRIIAIDRPGYGGSSLRKSRKILDWPAAVEQLAKHLQLSEYRVLGASGGAPYALACALRLPRDKLMGVGVACGAGPEYLQSFEKTALNRLLLIMMACFPMRHTTWILDRALTQYALDIMMPRSQKTNSLNSRIASRG